MPSFDILPEGVRAVSTRVGGLAEDQFTNQRSRCIELLETAMASTGHPALTTAVKNFAERNEYALLYMIDRTARARDAAMLATDSYLAFDAQAAATAQRNAASAPAGSFAP